MNIYQLLVILIIVVAAVAILQWFVAKSKITISQPVMIIIYAVCAIVAIAFLFSLAGMGPVAVRW